MRYCPSLNAMSHLHDTQHTLLLHLDVLITSHVHLRTARTELVKGNERGGTDGDPVHCPCELGTTRVARSE